MSISEKLMEDLIAEYPHEFIEDELILIERQSIYCGRRIDLLFRDRFNRLLLVEIKRGTLTREDIGQIHEYYGVIKNEKPRENLELMFIANIIPPERKRLLEEFGVNFKEITEDYFLKVAEKYDKNIELIEKISEKQSSQSLPSYKTGEKIAGKNIGIVFCSKGEEHTIVAMEHLKTNKELYFSVGYPIGADKFSYPLIGLIHISGDKGGKVRYKCRITGIKPYSPSDHKDLSKKPEIWIKEHKDKPRPYKTTIIIDVIEPFIYETNELRNLDGKRIRIMPGYQLIVLP